MRTVSQTQPIRLHRGAGCPLLGTGHSLIELLRMERVDPGSAGSMPVYCLVTVRGDCEAARRCEVLVPQDRRTRATLNTGCFELHKLSKAEKADKHFRRSATPEQEALESDTTSIFTLTPIKQR
jgi:hypothetical protein